MAQHVKRFGKWLLVLIPLAVFGLLAFRPGTAKAATYSDPWWTHTSASPECVGCSGCGCSKPPEFLENVSVRTREVAIDLFLFATPSRLGQNRFSLRWRSMLSGLNETGRGMVGSWQHTMREVSLGGGDHEVEWRRPDGLLIMFDHDAGVYTSFDCNVQETLTKVSSHYELTGVQGEKWVFDDNGMPDVYYDANSNATDFTYNSSLQLTALLDDRGKAYTVHHNGGGFIDHIEDYAEQQWLFEYDEDGNLITITTPETPDQGEGCTTTLDYDDSNRLVSVEDARGNTVREFAYDSSTAACATATIDGQDITFAANSGRTDVTDRRGHMHRFHFSGNTITQEDMWISSAAKFVTQYRYNGSDLVTIVQPNGNRIDFTWNGDGQMTNRRQKLTDTDLSNPTDIVETWAYTSGFVTSYTDPLNSTTTYTRNPFGNLTAINYPNVSLPAVQTSVSKTFTLNVYGQTTSQTDEDGRLIDFAYGTTGNANGLLTSEVVDPGGLGLETTFGYDTAGNLTTVTDPAANVTVVTWDALRRRTQTEDASGALTTFHYDANGNLVTMNVENIDEDGDAYANQWLTTTFTYTNLNDLASRTEEIDGSTTRTTSWTRDEEGHVTRVTKPEGNKDDFTYNERDLMASRARGATSVAPSTASFEYDDNGNLTVETDGRDNDTIHAYDAFNRRTMTTNALGHYRTWNYDKAGNVVQIARRNSSDTLLQRRNQQFDQRGRRWQTGDLRKDPSTNYSDAVTIYAHTKSGHLLSVRDARSNTTTYGYDNAWRRTSATDMAGNVTAYVPDENGNIVEWSQTDEDGLTDVTHEHKAKYDAMNRRISYSEIDRTNGSNVLVTTYGYDSRGNLVWTENALGKPTRYTFDGVGRMTMKEVALTFTGEAFATAIVTQWAFDLNDRLSSHKDDANNTTTWTYDALDRATAMVYADANDITYVYDANDNIVQTTDAIGSVIENTYDDLDRLTAREVTRASGVLDTTLEAFAYDGADRMTSAGDDDYLVEFTYAVVGFENRIYEEKQSYATGTPYLKTVIRTWDAMGNKGTEVYPSGLALAYTWTALNQLNTISDGSVILADYTYVGRRPTRLDYGNGSKSEFTYTGFHSEVGTLHHKESGSATLLRLDYGYDGNHDRLYERYGAPGQPGDAFANDAARRLTTAWMGSVTPATPTSVSYTTKFEYNLDDDGNRTSVVTTPYGSSASTTSYVDNPLNQYTLVVGVARNNDTNGNVTDDGTYLYEYNYKNLICQVRLKSNNSVVATYRYDALGRRVEKVITGATYRYIYSGDETVSVYTSTGTWKQDYVYDASIDGIVMLQQADVLDADGDSNLSETARSWYLRNALGSVLAVLEQDEDVAVSYRYDPYGNVTITRGGSAYVSDPLGQFITFTGRWRDEETKTYYYRARQQDPATGRFLQRDPEGTSEGPNLYEYVSSNPANATDPTGRFVLIFWIMYQKHLEAERRRKCQEAINRGAAVETWRNSSQEWLWWLEEQRKKGVTYPPDVYEKAKENAKAYPGK
jgi:RHS repeat-associated protein